MEVKMAVPDLHFECALNGSRYVFTDRAGSKCCPYIATELTADCYGINRIPFAPDDVVIDVGAHVGMFAIPLIKRFPFLTIHAFEPLLINYQNLIRNIELNSVTRGIELYRIAITKDGRDVEVAAKKENTGSGSILFKKFCTINNTAPSITLAEFLDANNISRIKLLKLDCEGAELEIVMHSDSALQRVEFLAVEVHKTKFEKIGIDCSEVVERLKELFPAEKLAMKIL
jgi:FkbM family methyltransferase